MIGLDYSVLKLLHRSDLPLKVGSIAKNLNLPHSTLGSCIVRLQNGDLVKYKAYKEVILTEKGRELARELIRHAQLIELFLHKSLGLSIEEAHEESEKINFLFTCETVNRICEKFNHPTTCPCGKTILESRNCYCEIKK
ncbi:MAG: metal-dependent transcriptional regulator [Promethearchaeota archaeon]|jgi:DtxR family Mn-dependent transcriptional regulator